MHHRLGPITTAKCSLRLKNELRDTTNSFLFSLGNVSSEFLLVKPNNVLGTCEEDQLANPTERWDEYAEEFHRHAVDVSVKHMRALFVIMV